MDDNKKHNSINDYTAQTIKNNQNIIELLTKIDQAVNSNESFISVKTTDSSGKEVITQLPSIGHFKTQLEQVQKYFRKLTGSDNNAAYIRFADNEFKKIISTDLNQLPRPISALTPVSTFTAEPNWIFDDLLNPKIKVELDLTGKIDEFTKKIECKRFIVEFEKILQLDGTTILTPQAQLRLQEFNNKYKDQSNIDIIEFVQWLDTPGLINRFDEFLIDQEFFDLQPNRPQFKGDFSITGTELDNVNKKLWYVLDTLTYYDISDNNVAPKPVQLQIGDLVKINPINNGSSATVYKVVEISTITSQFRVRFELVFGEEPIQVRLNSISMYSDSVPKRTVKVTIGFDEHTVVFVRAQNEHSFMVQQQWSPGIGFYTNELRFENLNGETFNDYYIKHVYDYGMILQDLVEKKIPNYYAQIPNTPILNLDNFKVVQTNQHLTQTADAERLRDLHNEKINLSGKITQIENTIEKQNRLLATTQFNSASDRKRAEDELVQLTQRLNSNIETRATCIKEILANKKNINKIAPEYRLRGFWPMVEAAINTQTRPQEVVQYEIRYRRLSKSGDENPILTIQNLSNESVQNASELSVNIEQNKIKPKTVNATFSNWTQFKTDARKRVQNLITGEWFWEIEDVEDANTPNINQLDIEIHPGERIEFQVRSISEVGWPETPIVSEWSESIIKDFPDNLNSVLNEDDFILQEATIDESRVKFESDLNARGLNLHLSTSIRDVDIYYAHTANAIASGFKDSSGKMINLYDKLLELTNKYEALREELRKAKGELTIYLLNKGNATKIFNSNNIINTINLEDYLIPTRIGITTNPIDSARTYVNDVVVIQDFSIMIKNSAQSANLGLLSYRGYGSPNGMQSSPFAYTHPQSGRGIQALWTNSNHDLHLIEGNGSPNPAYTSTTQIASQQNNQWLWLQVKDLNGNDIYAMNSAQQPTNGIWSSDNADLNSGVNRGIHDVIIDSNRNLGVLSTEGIANLSGGGIKNLLTKEIWDIREPINNSGMIGNKQFRGRFATTIHPSINNFADLTDTSASKIKYINPGEDNAVVIPINIYAKIFTGTRIGNIGQTGIIEINDQISNNFDDQDNITNGGQMPKIIVSTNNIKKNTQDNLVIILEGTTHAEMLKVGDKLLLNGFTHTDLLNANNVPLDILSISGAEITLRYSAPNLSTDAVSNPTQEDAKLIQIHKRHVHVNVFAYTVLGQLDYPGYGGDLRVVDSYVEIKSGKSTSGIQTHSKKVRFYLEDENNPRPFDFELTFNIQRHKQVAINFPQLTPLPITLGP